MSRPESPGALFRRALNEEQPLQIIGAINANHALLAKSAQATAPSTCRAAAWRRVRWGCRTWASILRLDDEAAHEKTSIPSDR